MRKRSILILALGLVFLGRPVFSQHLEVEKNIELTGKSKSKGG